MERTLIMGIVFLASATQSLSGFGIALVAIALLPGLLAVGVAVPLVAMLAFTLEFFLLLWYRNDLDFRAVLPVTGVCLRTVQRGVTRLMVDE